jgi:hypothetical protein
MSLFKRDSFNILRMSDDGANVDGIYVGAERVVIPARGNAQPAVYTEQEVKQNAGLQGKDLSGCMIFSSETQFFAISNSGLRKSDVISWKNRMYEVRAVSDPYILAGKTRYQAEADLISVLNDNIGIPVYGDAFRPYPYNQDVGITGTIDDDNKLFTLAQKIKPGSLELFNGSAKYQPSDYTLADDGITVTLSEGTTAPSAGDPDNNIPADILTARGAF